MVAQDRKNWGVVVTKSAIARLGQFHIHRNASRVYEIPIYVLFYQVFGVKERL